MRQSGQKVHVSSVGKPRNKLLKVPLRIDHFGPKSMKNAVPRVVNPQFGYDWVFDRAHSTGDSRKKVVADKSVSSREICDFVSALTTERVEQGIFVATSDFTSDAKQTAMKSGEVKLMNGQEFSRIMVKTGLGVRKTALDVPKVDEDFAGFA